MQIPWHRVFQFRLRTLLVASITLSAVAGYYANLAHRQAGAAAKILSLGGEVYANRVSEYQ